MVGVVMTAKVIPLAQRRAGGSNEPQTASPETELSFDELVERFAPYIETIALRILGSGSDAEDVVQDTFLAAYRGMHTLVDPSGVRAWLGKIAVNLSARRLRRRRLRAAMGLEHNPPFLPSAAATAEQSALLKQIFAVLEELPPRFRIPWALRYLQGERLEAVAQMCDCSLSSVKRRITRAQQAIEATLGDQP